MKRLPLLASFVLLGATAAARADVPDFETHVLPILRARCWKCHSDGAPKGSLDLRTKAAMLRGGDAGPALTPGAAGKSALVKRIEAGEMPPEGEARLAPEQVAVLKAWIAGGAPAPEAKADAAVAETRPIIDGRKHWAFQKLSATKIPRVGDTGHGTRSVPTTLAGRVRTPVDAFVLSKLEAKKLTFAPDADRYALIRRLSFDLLGLPPSPGEIEAFVGDKSPDAYERLVDRLLASPHFGERWSRHWLDGAGYVDVYGGDNDAAIIKVSENKWRYRDYVVRSFNDDKPFAQFLTEQLAGDELADWRRAATLTPAMRELLIATGFLRHAADDTNENELNTADIRHGVLQRTGEVLAGNLLGLTLQCAKCHNHKYEPIAQRDYYRFLAILQPAFNPDRWLQPQHRELPAMSPAEKAELDRHNAGLDQQAAEHRRRAEAIREVGRVRLLGTKLSAITDVALRERVSMAVSTPAEKRDAAQKELAAKYEPILRVKPEEVAAALTPQEKAQAAQFEAQAAACQQQRRGFERWQVVYDVGPPTPTRLLRRGNHLAPGDEAPPGFPAVLAAAASVAASARRDPDLPAIARPAAAAGETSGRRLALAHWLTDTASPGGALVLRVRVNRIWQHLFGVGIVETPDNFGLSGAPPTHPELLDSLAGRFAADGERLKPFLRLLVTSTVYRQSSAAPLSAEGQEATGSEPTDPRTIDPDNRLLWRMRLRRLEAESVRDAMLAAAGSLDRTPGGPPIPVEPRPDGTFVVAEKGLPTPGSRVRRSLYLLARRNYHPTLLGVFDQPNLTTNCTRRQSSAVVLQALTMLNDPFVVSQADTLADRAMLDAKERSGDPVAVTFLIALGRPPRNYELSASRQFLREQTERLLRERAAHAVNRQALAYFCHVLLNSSEFLYIP